MAVYDIVPQIPIETTGNTQIVWVLEVTYMYLHHFTSFYIILCIFLGPRKKVYRNQNYRTELLQF